MWASRLTQVITVKGPGLSEQPEKGHGGHSHLMPESIFGQSLPTHICYQAADDFLCDSECIFISLFFGMCNFEQILSSYIVVSW